MSAVAMRQNLRFIKFESIITFSTLGAVEVMYLRSQGFTFGEIGLANAVVTVAIMLMSIPTGYLADVTSRRICNLTGDALVAVGLTFFASVDSFKLVIVANIVIGTGFALSLGIDTALLKAACERLDENFKQHFASMQIKTGFFTVAWALIAGIIAIHAPRIGVFWVALPFVFGFFVSLYITEVRTSTESVTGIKKAFRHVWTNKKMRWAVLMGCISISAASIIQNLAVPLAQKGGAPLLLSGVAWAVYFLIWSSSIWLYKQVVDKWKKRTLVLLPAATLLGSLGVLASGVNEWTLPAFLFIALAHGWLASFSIATIVEEAPEELRATVTSIFSTVMQIVFVIYTLVVTHAANQGIDNAMTACFLLSALPFLAAVLKLFQHCK